MARSTARFVNLALTSLTSGVFVGTRLAFSPGIDEVSPSTYVETKQAMIRNLDPVMRVLVPASVASTGAVLWGARDRSDSLGFSLTAINLVTQLAYVASTVRGNLPINKAIMNWSPHAPPPGWEIERDRWERLHTFRTSAALLGQACMFAAALADRRSQSG